MRLLLSQKHYRSLFWHNPVRKWYNSSTINDECDSNNNRDDFDKDGGNHDDDINVSNNNNGDNEDNNNNTVDIRGW